MRYQMKGRGLLGLVAVTALGVMAFAASAQAVTPLFNVNGLTNLEATISGAQVGTGTLLVPSSNLSLQCAEIEVKEGVLLTGGQVGHAKILYKGSKVFEHKSPFAELPCQVSDVAGGKPELLHVTTSFLILPVEIAGIGVSFGLLYEKASATVNFLSGTGCPLPLKNVVKGDVCSKIVAANDATRVVTRFSRPIQDECPPRVLEALGDPAGPKVKDKLLFGANEAFIESLVELFGTGAHAEKTLGVLLL